MSLQWYAIRIRPVHRLEFEVLHALHQREHPAMVPFDTKWEKRRGGKGHAAKRYPIFPCYVFAGFQHVDEFSAAKVFINTLAEAKGKHPPIVALVGYGSRPAVLSAMDVSFLEALSAPKPTSVNLHKALQVGGKAQITEGPFSGLEVQVMSVSSKKARIKLLKAKLLNMEEIDINPASLVAA